MSRRKVGITVDFLDDVMLNVFTKDKIAWLLEMFTRHGIEHVNWYYQPPYTGLFRDCGIMREMLESLKHVPDHLETAIEVGHELGLEMFTTFKPYEEGMGFSFPRGSEMDRKYGRIDRIGGRAVWVTDWISEHPHLRVKRRMDDVPDNILDVVIDRIELDKRDNVPVGPTRDAVKVYVSRDNVKYEELTSDWRLREEVVPALLLDYFGNQLNTESHETCRVTLSDLDVGPEWRFLAVDAGDRADQFTLIPMTMCRVFDKQGRKLPVTFATGADERKSTAQQGQHFVGDTAGDGLGFQSSGFEYDLYGRAMGYSMPGLGTAYRPLKLGIARGVNEYLPGAPCEAYPEVREHWMEEIRKIIQLGVDGVEIRHSNHASDTQDPYAYGFNEPILERYRQQQGTDGIAFDPVTIMRIRGEFLTQFVEQAAAEIRTAGKTVQVQVISQYASGEIRGMATRAFTGVWPDWEKWVRDFADGITFRDLLIRHYNPGFDRCIRQFARSLGKQVWMPCYFHMAHNNVNDAYLQELEQDETVTGVMFYEAYSTYEERNGRFELKPEFAEPFQRFMERNNG